MATWYRSSGKNASTTTVRYRIGRRFFMLVSARRSPTGPLGSTGQAGHSMNFATSLRCSMI
jgi:hypothetical protein